MITMLIKQYMCGSKIIVPLRLAIGEFCLMFHNETTLSVSQCPNALVSNTSPNPLCTKMLVMLKTGGNYSTHHDHSFTLTFM